MNRKIKLLLFLALVASAVTLVTCKPLDYYLQQVFKAYGKVTDANTGAPLESVEVFVKGCQYSELTNGLGDYEIELAEGTWTLEYVKDGYNTADSDPPVTVGSTNPRVLADVRLSPKEQSIIGTWFGTQGPTPSGGFIDVKVTCRADGTFEALILDVGGDTPKAKSNRGTYVCSGSIMHAQNTEIYDGSNWVPNSAGYDVPYSLSDNGNKLTMYIDSSTTWALTRQ